MYLQRTFGLDCFWSPKNYLSESYIYCVLENFMICKFILYITAKNFGSSLNSTVHLKYRPRPSTLFYFCWNRSIGRMSTFSFSIPSFLFFNLFAWSLHKILRFTSLSKTKNKFSVVFVCSFKSELITTTVLIIPFYTICLDFYVCCNETYLWSVDQVHHFAPLAVPPKF